MRHFSFLDAEQLRLAFHRPPRPVGLDAPADLVGCALGALLYTPATHRAIAESLVQHRRPGLTSTVLCLEDAIADGDVADGEANLVRQLAEVDAALRAEVISPDDLPLIFLRVRSADQLHRLAMDLGHLGRLVCGVVMPKFTAANGAAFFASLRRAEQHIEGRWLAMPVLEGPELAYREERSAELQGVAAVLGEHRSQVACVRVGATDLSGVFGLRRPPQLSVYDVAVVRDAIADVVGFLARPGRDHVISGPVWEHFDVVAPAPAGERRGPDLAGPLGPPAGVPLSEATAGLVREVVLDRANGLLGKTVIHPTHVPLVNALHAVTLEEYADAEQVLQQAARGGGAVGAPGGGRMNEAGPHRRWADRVLRRADAFGVLRGGVAEDHVLGLTWGPALRRARTAS